MLEVELAKEKALCTKDKDGLGLSKRLVEEQLAECGKVQEQLRQERQLAVDQLQKNLLEGLVEPHPEPSGVEFLWVWPRDLYL